MSQQMCRLFVTFENRLGIHKHTDTLLATPSDVLGKSFRASFDWSELTDSDLHINDMTDWGMDSSGGTSDRVGHDCESIASKPQATRARRVQCLEGRRRLQQKDTGCTTTAVKPCTEETAAKSKQLRKQHSALNNFPNIRRNEQKQKQGPSMAGKGSINTNAGPPRIGIGNPAFAEKVKKIDKVSSNRVKPQISPKGLMTVKKRLSFEEERTRDSQGLPVNPSYTDELVQQVALMNFVDSSEESFERRRGVSGQPSFAQQLSTLDIGVESVQRKTLSSYSPVTTSSGYGSDRDILREEEIDQLLYGDHRAVVHASNGNTSVDADGSSFVIGADSLYPDRNTSPDFSDNSVPTKQANTTAAAAAAVHSTKDWATLLKQFSPQRDHEGRTKAGNCSLPEPDGDTTLTEVNQSMRDIIKDLGTPISSKVTPVVPNGLSSAKLGRKGNRNWASLCGPYENLPPRLASQVTPPRHLDMTQVHRKSAYRALRKMQQTGRLRKGLSLDDTHLGDYSEMSRLSPGRRTLGSTGLSAFKPYRRVGQESLVANTVTAKCRDFCVVTSTPMIPSDQVPNMRRAQLFGNESSNKDTISEIVDNGLPCVCPQEVYNSTSPDNATSPNSCTSADSGRGSCTSNESSYGGPEEPIYEIIEEDISSYLKPEATVSPPLREVLVENTYASIDCSFNAPVIEPPELPPRTYRETLSRHTRNSVTSLDSRETNHKNKKVVRWEDIVKKTDIVDMNAFHVYTVADVLESFDRLSAHLPQARDNIFSLIGDERGCENVSKSLELEKKLKDNSHMFKMAAKTVLKPLSKHRSAGNISRTDGLYQPPRPVTQRVHEVHTSRVTHLNGDNNNCHAQQPSGHLVRPIAPCRKILKSASYRHFSQEQPMSGDFERQRHLAPKRFSNPVPFHLEEPRAVHQRSLSANFDRRRGLQSYHSMSSLQWTTGQHLQETYC